MQVMIKTVIKNDKDELFFTGSSVKLTCSLELESLNFVEDVDLLWMVGSRL